jgi:hypothetical protein
VKEIDNLKDVAINGRILQWILKKWNLRTWTEMTRLWMETNGELE